MSSPAPLIRIEVETEYLESLSQPDHNKFLYSYTIHIHNQSHSSIKLLRRYWRITDGDGEVHEVEGEGVVGETPTIAPQEAYQYTSGMVLTSPFGCMQGHFQMTSETTASFDVPIPTFRLMMPDLLH